MPLFINPSSKCIGEKYFRLARCTEVPLDYHFVPAGQRAQAGRLLEVKPESSTHLLLYGPPGSGKTSFALGITACAGIPVHEILRNDDNSACQRRAAIVACLNLTNIGDGAIIIVDEADNLLNTDHAWQMRGEIHDKGWLNQLLETPGARIVWIVNQIDSIDSSVMRRFAFSIQFKPFNRRQRCLLWERLLSKHSLKRYFKASEIKNLAARHLVSAGAVDLALQKAAECGYRRKKPLQGFIEGALTAHTTLLQKGSTAHGKEILPEAYAIEGLNTDADLGQLTASATKFEKVLTQRQSGRPLNLNLLFHGPPGTGKSEFGRYLASALGRNCQCRRMSDFLDPFIGVTERNIREAFEQAEAEEAVLIVDEVDSLLFPRDRAQRSWEVSHTNEFLTSMERFCGILICTTNRFEDLDAASIRRFVHKIKFDYLTSKGNRIFYERLLAFLVKNPMTQSETLRLGAIERLTPGDFSAVARSFSFYSGEKISHHLLVGALEEEVRLKRAWGAGKSIGF